MEFEESKEKITGDALDAPQKLGQLAAPVMAIQLDHNKLIRARPESLSTVTC